MIDPSPAPQGAVSTAAPDTSTQNAAPQNAPTSQLPQTAQTTSTPTPQQTQQPSVPSQSAPAPNAQPNGQPATVTNAPATDPATQHAVNRASRVYQAAQALAGGPRWQLQPQADGTVKRTPVPLSKSDILMSIALEAISGSLSGLAQSGPGATARAAAAGAQTTSQALQTANAQAEQQAQSDAQARAGALARQASIYEQNSRTVLNTQQAERLGLDSLKDAAAQNESLLQSYRDAGAVGDTNVTQDALMDGMKSGKYSGTSMTAIPDGWTNVPGKGFEQTFSIITKPGEKVNLSQGQVDAYAAAHVRGFPKGMKIANGGYPVAGYILANANAQMLANRFMLQEASDVQNTLAKSDDQSARELAKGIPDLGKLMDDPQHGLALQNALPKLQKYLHHDGTGDTFYQALVSMSQPTRPNPSNPKQPIDNTADANAAQVIASAFGGGDPNRGFKVLKAYHDTITPAPLKSEAEAEGVISDPASTLRQVRQAQKYLAVAAHQKQAEAAAKKAAEGTGTPAGNTTADVQRASDAIANGQGTFEQLTQGMGKEAAAFRRQVEADLLRRYPNVNLGALKAYSKAADSQAVQSQITNARSLFGANGQPGSFDQLEDAIRAVPKASFPMLSELRQKTAYNLGSPEMATLKAIKTDIASDLAKFNAGGGNHSSDHQVELYREQLNEAQTPEQVEAVLKDLRVISSKRFAGIVGTNPYLANMTQDINDPVTKQPKGNGGAQVPQSRIPAPPPGATMRVPGSDGKMHWSDGKRDLGVIQ